MRFATLGSALALGLAPFAAQAQGMRLDSPDIAGGRMVANKHVFNGFGCKGENVSPALRWQNPPKGTQSFALLVHDPDAPTGGAGWWHWAVVNIPAAATGLEQGAGAADGAKLPAGSRQVNTDFGAPGYGGPCPPPGKPHRYVFTLSALDIDKMPVPDDASGALVGFNIGAHTLAKATITAMYGR